MRICTTAEKLRQLVSRPSFQAVRVFDTNLAAVQLFRDKVKLNKPIAVGFSVLDLSKLRMYEFWYDFLMVAFANAKLSLLMSDTDSFLMHMETDDDVKAVLYQNREKFDFSKLSEGHPLKDDTNGHVPGKMKIQLPNEDCMESVVLSSKCYSVLTDRGVCSAMKGVSGQLTHAVYKEYIENDACYVGRVKSVKHFGQSLYQVSTERRMLSPVDTKRYYIIANRSLSFGHYKVANVN